MIPVPYADVVTSTTTKTMRGARGGVILCKKEFAKDIDKAIFPGVQGGAILPNVMAKAITFKIAMTESFKAYQRQVITKLSVTFGKMQIAAYIGTGC